MKDVALVPDQRQEVFGKDGAERLARMLTASETRTTGSPRTPNPPDASYFVCGAAVGAAAFQFV